MILFFLSGFLSYSAEKDTFDIIQINPCEMIEFHDLDEMMELEEFQDCVQTIDTANGVALGNYIGIKKDTSWVVWMQPNFAYDSNCGIRILSTEFKDVYGDEGKELVLTFDIIENGAKGGWEFEFYQVWDLNQPALLFETLTREHFSWYSKKSGSGTCTQEVQFSKDEIILFSADCTGETKGFELAGEQKVEVILYEEEK